LKQNLLKSPNLSLLHQLQLPRSKVAVVKPVPAIFSAKATRPLSRDRVPPVAAEALLALVWAEDRMLLGFLRNR
jgi:hypothetical protein